MSQRRIIFRTLLLLCILGIAAILRLRAVALLPIDYDEDDYLRAATQYATAIGAGDWAALTQINYRTEHPPLTKIVNGVALASLPPAPEIPDRPMSAPPATSLPEPYFTIARTTETGIGLIQILLVGLLSPLAALFLAIDTWQIKYTTQIMLETLPALTSAVAVFAYSKSKGAASRWLFLSAIALGLTAASKYVYCIAGIAILVHWAWSERKARALASSLPRIALWGRLALFIFIVADPYLWPDPLHRLSESVLYHIGYAQSEYVSSAGFPMWQPLVWLTSSVPWHPGVFFLSVDPLIAILALVGLPRLWRKQTVLALWFLIALAFLLVWSTKWPQYILILTVPLSFAAAEGFRALMIEPLGDTVSSLKTFRPHFSWAEISRALPWLVPGTVTLGLVAFFPLAYQGAMALTDMTTISLRDGINGGVWREVWQGITFQAEPVHVSLGARGSLDVRVEVRDRGELRLVPIADSGLAMREVHFAGFGLLAGLFSGLVGNILIFNVLWTLFSVSSQLVMGVGLALMLNRPGVRGRRFWQIIFILPWAVPEFVGVLCWLHIFDPRNGWLSLWLGHPLSWQQDALGAFAVLLITGLWLGFPFMMLAATAGLKMVPVEVYDAAAVDGAGRWSRLRYITLPLLFPLLGPALVVRAIFSFNQFYLFYVLQPPYPMFTLSTLSFYFLNSNSSLGGQYAFSAAINIFSVIVLILLLLWLNRHTRVAEGVTYA